MGPKQAVFDPQARDFDRRVGLPVEAPAQVATAVVVKSVLRRGDWLLEVGCGTGELGVAVAEELAKVGNGYLGFDVSRGMLEVFRQRLVEASEDPGTSSSLSKQRTPEDPGTSAAAFGEEASEDPGTPLGPLRVGLVQADGNAPWPVADGSVGAVFGSRALHLLDLEHVERETVRVLGERGGVLLVGRVVRPEEAPVRRLRREMQRLLRRRGFEGRGGRRRVQQLFDRCCRRGAALIEPVPVLQWETEKSPGKALRAWRKRRGLAGLELPEEVKADVLDQLEGWARETFGSLDRPSPTEETYTLEGVHFPAGADL